MDGQKRRLAGSLPLITLLVLCAACPRAYAQYMYLDLPSLASANLSHAFVPGTGVVTGHLVADSGEPIPHGSVLVEGTHRGAITDESGAFRIVDVPAGTRTLVARVMGYKTVRHGGVRVDLGGTTSIDIRLQATVIHLSPGLEIKGMRGPTRRAGGTDAPHSAREDSLALFGSWALHESRGDLGSQPFTDSKRPHLSFHVDGTYEHYYGVSAARDPLACSGTFTVHPFGGRFEDGRVASLWIDLGRCPGLMFHQWLVAFSGRDTIVIYPGGGNAIVMDASALIYVRERAALSTGWVEPCPSPSISAQDWRTVQLRGFSMLLPPEYHEAVVHGIDSYVGSYETSDSTGRISFGLGGFSDPLDRSEGFSRYGSCSEVIGGKEARVISAVRMDGELPQEYRYYLGAAWREVRPNLHLTLWAEAKNLTQVKRLLAVLRTVRFDDERRYRRGEK